MHLIGAPGGQICGKILEFLVHSKAVAVQDNVALQ